MSIKEAGNTPDLRSMRIGAVLNTASGSCDIEAEHEMQALLSDAGLEAQKIWCGGADQVADALKEASSHELDVLIVLGGDGTIRAAAETCSERGPFLVPLPGGTMNMLPKALYEDLSWQDALRVTLEDPDIQNVNGGRIGSHQFFVAAIIGNPSLWAEAREAVREGELATAVVQGVAALKKAFNNELQYEFGEEAGSAEAVSVLCPLTSSALDDNERTLEAAAISPSNALEAFSLALRAVFSEWRADQNVVTAKVRRVRVRADEPIPAILDGETVEIGATATVEFVPNAFKALVPAKRSRAELMDSSYGL